MRFASDETLMARETTEPTSDFAFDAKKRKSFDLNQDADTLSQVGSQLSRQILIGRAGRCRWLLLAVAGGSNPASAWTGGGWVDLRIAAPGPA
jgi:hypothetical protein